MSIDLNLLRSLPQHVLKTQLRSPRGVNSYTFKGALLHEYAQDTGLLEDTQANHYFVARSGDGFIVALAMAEVAPDYSDKQVLLATEQNGEPIRSGVRLVVPGDDLGGRSVFGLEGIEVRSVDSKPLSSAPSSSSLRLVGQLDRPATFDAGALLAMDQAEVEPVESQGHEAMRPRHAYHGVPVWRLLENAGMQLDAAINEHVLRKIVVARDSDGYAVVIAAGEVEPRFLGAPFVVGLADETGPLGHTDGGLRLIAPYDKAGARNLKGIATLELKDA